MKIKPEYCISVFFKFVKKTKVCVKMFEMFDLIIK